MISHFKPKQVLLVIESRKWYAFRTFVRVQCSKDVQIQDKHRDAVSTVRLYSGKLGQSYLIRNEYQTLADIGVMGGRKEDNMEHIIYYDFDVQDATSSPLLMVETSQYALSFYANCFFSNLGFSFSVGFCLFLFCANVCDLCLSILSLFLFTLIILFFSFLSLYFSLAQLRTHQARHGALASLHRRHRFTSDSAQSNHTVIREQYTVTATGALLSRERCDAATAAIAAAFAVAGSNRRQ